MATETVWILEETDCNNGHTVHGIFTSEEKAKKAKYDYIIHCFEEHIDVSKSFMQIMKLKLDDALIK